MCSANINVHAHIYDNIIIKKKHMQNFIQKKIQLFISIPNILYRNILGSFEKIVSSGAKNRQLVPFFHFKGQPILINKHSLPVMRLNGPYLLIYRIIFWRLRA
jgi:hypothetical protein